MRDERRLDERRLDEVFEHRAGDFKVFVTLGDLPASFRSCMRGAGVLRREIEPIRAGDGADKVFVFRAPPVGVRSIVLVTLPSASLVSMMSVSRTVSAT
jgi:hypothetical protein